ncbi:NTP transferase domain-containing protein, partial [Oceanibaculum nanhaiense]|uniref:nucleotidyltransferase family protein n=1 Tax=Oceanibaculum nanhaiense TaxID=1909734 RepID=UPI00396DB845
PLTVVTGHEAARVKAALPGDLAFADNPDYAAGLSASLKAGIAALPADIDGVVVCLGDMPRISPAMIDRLIAAFDPVEGREICVPTYKGKRGNPVLWGRRFLPEMAALAGDVGAKHLIGAHADLVVEVEMDEKGVLIDIDTPDALTRYQRG